MVQNKGLILKSRPSGWPVPGKDLAIEARDFDLDAPPPEGGITTKNHYVSFDPYQRGRMRPPETKSYTARYAIDKPITNFGVSRVRKSDNEKFKTGDIVNITNLPTEEYSTLAADGTRDKVRKLDNPYNLDPKLFIGALGMPGLTAYSSFYAIGEPKRGETIFVSAASGAVGQIVGQLAKHEGLIVIGSVGNDEKLKFIKEELQFDEGFNYKNEKPGDALTRLAPKGIDIYYENVGGEHLDAALVAMNDFGRISKLYSGCVRNSESYGLTFILVASGMISQYNNATDSDKYGVKNLGLVVTKRIKLQGFIVFDPDMGPKYAAEHQANVARWIHEGNLKVKQSITHGLDNAISGFIGMLRGENFGKAILTIEELDDATS